MRRKPVNGRGGRLAREMAGGHTKTDESSAGDGRAQTCADGEWLLAEAIWLSHPRPDA
ncbi:hypothetical protein BO443_90107 [Burkholderia orbicola]